MKITTSKTKTGCIMLFWISNSNAPHSTVPITFIKTNVNDDYVLCNWSERRSLDDIIELLRDYFPNIDESMRIDEELEIILRLKYS